MAQVRACLLIVILLLSSVVGRAAGEPWSEDFTPPPGDYSWVQLDTGEWLKGEIIALYDETLVFDSDHFGDLQIDLDDRARYIRLDVSGWCGNTRSAQYSWSEHHYRESG
jgi:hypothetical protein